MNILIIEDDLNLSKALEHILKKENYSVEVANDGNSGYEKASQNNFDVIVLDRMLPGMDGISICKKLRNENIATPIIMLTARDSMEDKIEGFDSGADDYMTKPFAPPELLAHIKALGRRKGVIIKENLKFEDLELNEKTSELLCNGQEIKLDKIEYKIMKEFLKVPSELISKNNLVEKVWGSNSYVGESNLNSYITFLTKKLNFLNSNCLIIKENENYILTKTSND